MAVQLEEPFRKWVVTVETQHRIRLPTEITRFAGWLAVNEEGQQTHVGTMSAFGGMQISPDGGRFGEARRSLVEKLLENPAKAGEAGADWLNLARYFATSWPVTFQMERKPSRITINLPAEARKLGIVPKAGEIAVVFATGEILEICGASEWVKLNNTMSEKLNEILERAENQLSERCV